MKVKLIVAIVVVALVITAAVVVAAGRGWMRGAAGSGPGGAAGCPMGLGGPWLAKELDLTQQQVTQLQQIRTDYMNATQATRQQLQTQCQQMADLWTAERPDVAQIKALAADMDALRAQMRDTGVDYMLRGLQVLTPQQREKVRTTIKNTGAKCMYMGFGMGFGMGPGGGLGMGTGTGPRAQMGICPNVGK